MRRLMVAGNWKMNGSRQMLSTLIPGVMADDCVSPRSEVDVVMCPPSVYLHEAAAIITAPPMSSGIKLGAQNVSHEASGAYTGEVSVSMLAEMGVEFVIVGHSERRAMYGESDTLVGSKAQAVLAQGLVPIVCVGETLEERDAGNTEGVVARQLDAVIDAIGETLKRYGADSEGKLLPVVLAYEPVWAIGTGKTATPEQAQEVHAFLRQRIKSRYAPAAVAIQILYGGSVKGDNAAALFANPDIDGGLIGGASLSADDFLAIINAAHM